MKQNTIHVVAAVIYDRHKQHILIAKRPNHTHQGGKWEFPGGKVETDESPQQALQRELAEELGIQISSVQSLIQINHEYPDKSVFLDVYEVNQFTGSQYFSGQSVGNEGQTICWVKTRHLSDYTFPEANHPILQTIQSQDSKFT